MFLSGWEMVATSEVSCLMPRHLSLLPSEPSHWLQDICCRLLNLEACFCHLFVIFLQWKKGNPKISMEAQSLALVSTGETLSVQSSVVQGLESHNITQGRQGRDGVPC